MSNRKKIQPDNTDRSKIHIENCQVKSLEKAKRLCALLDEVEKEFGIKSVIISFKNNFICPDIDLLQLANSADPMERLIGDLLIRIDIKMYGNNSRYKKVKK